MVSFDPCFVRTGNVVEKDDVLGGGDCRLAVDLQDNFGQNCFW